MRRAPTLRNPLGKGLLAWQGRITTRDHPAFLGEQSVVLAPDMFKEYVTRQQLRQNELFLPTVYAGNYDLVFALRTWCETGVAKLASAAAPNLIRGYQQLESWLQTKLVHRPQVTPMTTETSSTHEAGAQGTRRSANETG